LPRLVLAGGARGRVRSPAWTAAASSARGGTAAAMARPAQGMKAKAGGAAPGEKSSNA
jgi:hypothetical protein